MRRGSKEAGSVLMRTTEDNMMEGKRKEGRDTPGAAHETNVKGMDGG